MSSNVSRNVSRVVVAYDAEHHLHAGPHTSAESPDRVEAIVAHLGGIAGIEWHVTRAPVPTRAWPVGTAQNCSACTFPLEPGTSVCGMCLSRSTHAWNYIQDKEGDTTYQTPYTQAIVERASRLVTSEMTQLCSVPAGAALTFALTRPPGHHACCDKRVGFCHRNFAIDALDTAHAHGKRAVIVDIDAHHGDGTEREISTRAYGHYCSLHAFGEYIYPGTGGVSTDRCLNVPLSAATADAEWVAAFDAAVMPWLRDLAADVVILSCGLDAHRDDAIVPLRLTAAAYRHCAEQLRAMEVHVLAILEGGYHVPVLGPCVEAIIAPFLP
jgi:acetoin utilization deacetylase AcuC-like enzyme